MSGILGDTHLNINLKSLTINTSDELGEEIIPNIQKELKRAMRESDRLRYLARTLPILGETINIDVSNSPLLTKETTAAGIANDIIDTLCDRIYAAVGQEKLDKAEEYIRDMDLLEAQRKFFGGVPSARTLERLRVPPPPKPEHWAAEGWAVFCREWLLGDAGYGKRRLKEFDAWRKAKNLQDERGETDEDLEGFPERQGCTYQAIDHAKLAVEFVRIILPSFGEPARKIRVAGAAEPKIEPAPEELSPESREVALDLLNRGRDMAREAKFWLRLLAEVPGNPDKNPIASAPLEAAPLSLKKTRESRVDETLAALMADPEPLDDSGSYLVAGPAVVSDTDMDKPIVPDSAEKRRVTAPLEAVPLSQKEMQESLVDETHSTLMTDHEALDDSGAYLVAGPALTVEDSRNELYRMIREDHGDEVLEVYKLFEALNEKEQKAITEKEKGEFWAQALATLSKLRELTAYADRFSKGFQEEQRQHARQWRARLTTSDNVQKYNALMKQIENSPVGERVKLVEDFYTQLTKDAGMPQTVIQVGSIGDYVTEGAYAGAVAMGNRVLLERSDYTKDSIDWDTHIRVFFHEQGHELLYKFIAQSGLSAYPEDVARLQRALKNYIRIDMSANMYRVNYVEQHAREFEYEGIHVFREWEKQQGERK